jgi:hypothetical protein
MAAPPADPGPDGGSSDDRLLSEGPPFATWGRIYAIVLGALAVEIVIFTVLARVLR